MRGEQDVRALKESMAEILGRQLSSVEFVQDYLQLRFDGPCLTAITLPVVHRGGTTITSIDSGYRDALCALIGKQVERVDATVQRLQVSFPDGTALAISLLDDDYRGPEALHFITEDGRWVVV